MKEKNYIITKQLATPWNMLCIPILNVTEWLNIQCDMITNNLPGKKKMLVKLSNNKLIIIRNKSIFNPLSIYNWKMINKSTASFTLFVLLNSFAVILLLLCSACLTNYTSI